MRTRLSLLLGTLVVSGCGLLPPAPSDDPPLAIEASAGPVCPVEQMEVPGPPDPRCAPRPVEGARMVITAGDESGPVAAEGVTGANGRVEFDLRPGDYVVTAGPVEGLMGQPEPFAFTLRANEPAVITIPYDTGIR